MAPAGFLFVIIYGAFIIKHLLGDYLLQTTRMVAGKERPSDWFFPLVIHCAVHGALTAVIVIAVAPGMWWLAFIDFFIHGAIDRSKGLVTRRLGLTPFTNARWWWIFGMDQSLHQFTHLGFVVLLMGV